MYNYVLSVSNYTRKVSAIKNRPGCLFIRTFFTEEFLYPLAWNCMHPPFNKFNMWDQDTPDFMEISSYPCNYIYIYNKSH